MTRGREGPFATILTLRRGNRKERSPSLSEYSDRLEWQLIIYNPPSPLLPLGLGFNLLICYHGPETTFRRKERIICVQSAKACI